MKEATKQIVCNSAELKVEDIRIVREEDGESVPGIEIVTGSSINDVTP